MKPAFLQELARHDNSSVRVARVCSISHVVSNALKKGTAKKTAVQSHDYFHGEIALPSNNIGDVLIPTGTEDGPDDKNSWQRKRASRLICWE